MDIMAKLYVTLVSILLVNKSTKLVCRLYILKYTSYSLVSYVFINIISSEQVSHKLIRI